MKEIVDCVNRVGGGVPKRIDQAHGPIGESAMVHIEDNRNLNDVPRIGHNPLIQIVDRITRTLEVLREEVLPEAQIAGDVVLRVRLRCLYRQVVEVVSTKGCAGATPIQHRRWLWAGPDRQSRRHSSIVSENPPIEHSKFAESTILAEFDYS